MRVKKILSENIIMWEEMKFLSIFVAIRKWRESAELCHKISVTEGSFWDESFINLKNTVGALQN